ncbi:MAG: DUF4430 domain-containing protein [Candidatus Aenigmatarchaeota archaeon]
MKQNELILEEIERIIQKLYENDIPLLKKLIFPAGGSFSFKSKEAKKSKLRRKFKYDIKRKRKNSDKEYKEAIENKKVKTDHHYIYQLAYYSSWKDKKNKEYNVKISQTSLSMSSELKLFEVYMKKQKQNENPLKILNAKIDENLEYVKEIKSTLSYADKIKSLGEEKVVKISYTDPVFINNQWTYQRIFIKNPKDGLTIYDLTLEKVKSGALASKVRYDEKFKTYYFEEIDGIRDGENKAYWEVWANGKIVEDALDKTTLKKGDVIEWRLANERENVCGGVKKEGLEPLYQSKLYNKFHTNLLTNQKFTTHQFILENYFIFDIKINSYI